jgi:hypothetical protein
MSVNILVDMNLSPDWVPVLQRHGWSAVHWSLVHGARSEGDRPGDHGLGGRERIHRVHARPRLRDGVGADPRHRPQRAPGPGQNVLPDHLEPMLVAALRQHEGDLASGALVVVDEKKARVRILPI